MYINKKNQSYNKIYFQFYYKTEKLHLLKVFYITSLSLYKITKK